MTLLLTLKTTVKCCARCQQDHVDLEFKELTNPGETKASHWALCPTLGEPILLFVTKTAKKKEPKDFGQTPQFQVFWAYYPNKQKKADAVVAWNAAKLDDKLPLILAALKWQTVSPSWTKDKGQFIPHPASYLRGKRWEDEPAVTHRAPQTSSGQSVADIRNRR